MSFSCHLCDFSASSHSNLRRHQYVHTGQKPHKCEICEYSCTNRSRLTEHMRVHTGQKPYTCTICGYKCSQSSILNSHRKRKHQHELTTENISQESPDKIDCYNLENSPDKNINFKQPTTSATVENESEIYDSHPIDCKRDEIETSDLVTTGTEKVKHMIMESTKSKELLMDSSEDEAVDKYELIDKICIARGKSTEDQDKELTNGTGKRKVVNMKGSQNFIIQPSDKGSIMYSHKLKLGEAAGSYVEQNSKSLTDDGTIIKTEPEFIQEPENAYYPW